MSVNPMAKNLFSVQVILVAFLQVFLIVDTNAQKSELPLPFSEYIRPNDYNLSANFRTIGSHGNCSFDKERTGNGADALGNRTPIRGSRNALGSTDHKILFLKLPMLPPFAPTHANASELCRKHSQIFLKEVNELKLWALKMYDASAKIPSGLLNGNVNQYGDFDQCIAVDEHLDKAEYNLDANQLLGMYCVSYIDIKAKPHLKNSDVLRYLQSHYMLRSNLSDPGHRLPRFSSINWAFCIPSSCSSYDLENAVGNIFRSYVSEYDIDVSVKVNPEMCYTKHSWKDNINVMSIVCFILVGALIMLTIFATAFDDNYSILRRRKGTGWDIMLSFSLKKNIKKLFSLSSPADDIKCIHGIRFLNALALLLSHKSIALFFNPFLNRTSMAEGLSYKWTVIARTAIIYTDSFIMISGLLTAYGLIKDLDKKGKIDVMRKYATRFIRLTPNFLAVILLCTYILVPMGSGPQWNMVMKHHSTLCKSYMWRNLLYIHNYFGFEDMCLTHTHQLGMEMQLFLVSPFLVYLLWKWTEFGFIVCMALGFISTALRYIATYNLRLSPLVYFGASVSQLFSTATNSYILPTHRITSYLFGIGMAYFLRRMDKDITMSKTQVFLGWTLCLAMGIWAMMGPTQVTSLNYIYTEHEAAFYMAFSPILWCTFVGWVIFASSAGYGGFFGDFLSWKGFVVFTRIAYALYLIQFPIFFYNVGSKRGPEFYDFGVLFNLVEIGVVLIASVALTLLVDLPSQNLRLIVFPEIRPARKEDDSVPTEETNALEKTRPNPREAISGADARRRAVG